MALFIWLFCPSLPEIPPSVTAHNSRQKNKNEESVDFYADFKKLFDGYSFSVLAISVGLVGGKPL